MNTIRVFFLILAVSVVLPPTAPLRAETTDLSGVAPFAIPSGRTGFLDQKTGKVYIYDNDMKNCLFIGQITELGQPIEKLQETQPTSSLEAKKYRVDSGK